MRAALAATVGALALALVAPGPGAAAPSDCLEPEAQFVYEPDEVAYILTMDVRSCRQFKKKKILLTGTLTRDAPVQGRRQTGNAECSRKEVCRLILGMGHLPVESARYVGEISYPWGGKRKSATVDVTCVSAAALAECT